MKMFITNAGIYVGSVNEGSFLIHDMVKTDMLVDKYGNININCLLLGDCDSFKDYIAEIELSEESPYFKTYKRMIESVKDEISKG